MTSRIQEWVAEQWFNKQPGGTPITAERLNRIEAQVQGVTEDLNVVDTQLFDAGTSADGAMAAAAAAQADADAALVNAAAADAKAVAAQADADAADVKATAAQTAADAAIPSTADIQDIVKITQAAYDALAPKVATTLYVIVG